LPAKINADVPKATPISSPQGGGLPLTSKFESILTIERIECPLSNQLVDREQRDTKVVIGPREWLYPRFMVVGYGVRNDLSIHHQAMPVYHGLDLLGQAHGGHHPGSVGLDYNSCQCFYESLTEHLQ